MFDRFLKNNSVYAPFYGEKIEISTVNDKVFSSKMMGDGVAFRHECDIISSPCSGKIIFLADTLHAFGVKMYNGAEILVHIGIDTVNLNGQGFEKLVEVNQDVKAGMPIVRLDLDYMKKCKADLTTMVILTNFNDYKIINEIENNYKCANNVKVFKTLKVSGGK